MPNGRPNKTLTIHVSPLIREALSAVQAGEDFDEALLRTVKAHYPEEATALFPAVSRLLEMEALRTKESKDQMLHRLAEAAPGPEITLNIGGGPVSKITAESKTYRVNNREYHSLEEMPPEIRRFMEQGIQSKESGRGRKTPRVGCTFSLLAGLLAVIARISGK